MVTSIKDLQPGQCVTVDCVLYNVRDSRHKCSLVFDVKDASNTCISVKVFQNTASKVGDRLEDTSVVKYALHSFIAYSFLQLRKDLMDASDE